MTLVVSSACTPDSPPGTVSSPSPLPSNAAALGPSAAPSLGPLPPRGRAWDTAAVVFPDRREPFDFRVNLENTYRDVLGRSRVSTFVDIEGAVIWTQEYVRYRLTGCSHQDAIVKVFFQIDNQNAPPPPDCGTERPFPDRREAFDFRMPTLEQKYRDGLRRQAQLLYVDPEGDVIWTMEYLRYRVGACSHGQATDRVLVDIRSIADGRGGSPQPACGPAPPEAPRAAFSVNPDAGTMVNAPQCAVQQTAGPRNLLRCTFDATASRPRPGITSYSWTFQGQDAQTVRSGDVLRGVTLPCGQFPGATTTDKMVTLTVTSPGGTASLPQTVTFVKQGPC